MKVKVTDFDTIATTAKMVMDHAVSCYSQAPLIDEPYSEGLLFTRIGQILSAMSSWYAQNFTPATWESDLLIDLGQVIEAAESISKLGAGYSIDAIVSQCREIERLVETLIDMKS